MRYKVGIMVALEQYSEFITKSPIFKNIVIVISMKQDSHFYGYQDN